MSLLNTIHNLFGNIFRISQGYTKTHDGLDLAAPIGTPVKAVAAGVVEYARDARTDPNCLNAWSCGGGNVVNINIGGNKATQYAHLSKINVSSGSRVVKGQVIGLVGDTGGKNPDGSFGGAGARFVGSHVHFGLWDKSAMKMIDPTSFLEGGAITNVLSLSEIIAAFQKNFKAIGISTDPTHKLTYDEALKYTTTYHHVSGDIAHSIALSLEGKTITDLAKDQQAGKVDSVNAISDAQNSLPNIDIGAALMFIAVILVGVAFLALGGIITLKGKS
jgi:hypothetical protein